MFKNLIVSALRSLRKKPAFSAINILGLALGMATCLTILLYVNHEISFDEFQKDNVYRIALNRVYPEREVDYTFIPHSIGPQLVKDFPEVQSQARFFKPNNVATFQYEDKTLTEEHFVIGDSTIFSIMSIEFIEGDPKTALVEDNSIVLSESTAKKFFGDQSAIGKILGTPGGNSVEVTAIVADYPNKSHFEFGAIIPLHSIPFFRQSNWAGFSTLTYIELVDGADPDDFEEKIPAFIKQYAEGEIQQRNGISYDEYIAAGNGYNYYLQPIKDIYLISHISGELKPNGNITYVYIFSIAAAFILLIACINFMNLATARSVERAKEVGIRKVMGSHKKQLVAQFLSESTFVAVISAVIALLITYLSEGNFAQLAGKNLSLLEFLTTPNIIILIVSVLIIGILAGLYPAFFISSYSPIGIMRGNLKTSKKGVGLRNALVVLQFTISIALISATLLIYNQMDYLLKKPLGFEKEQLVVIENGFSINNDPNNPNWERFETFKNEIASLPNIAGAGYTSALPGDILQGFIVRVPGYGEKESLVTRMISADDDFLTNMNMEILEGRNFSKNYNDSLSVIINLTTKDKLGFTDPIGKKIIHVDDSSQVSYTVVGVVDDFHFESLHTEVEPMIITKMGSAQSFVNKYAIKIDGDNIQQALASMEEVWGRFVPNAPFRYYFLDESLEQFYQSEQTSGKLFTAFTSLAIIVACIGLLGLSAFIINQKRKEIGVRKVLGGSVFSIVFLLSKDILKLILIATLIAIPAAYFWADSWLQNFAYSTGVSWLVFVFAGVGALLIALITVSFQSTKAAMANPVDSLKDE
ncbi:putative ABC transport system permease protein [Ekhidna lutea]|uniref:Putative ABC transport system permease protein n=1 Tax=Ekhidna lutea TaxID=447679 RepID=A0A239LFC0_EKHLU|nr:ABC transporter permease [Ekhidna lutea]SNT29035.1 putative ABC transport system permease protein [Ekhidna lutea]